MKSGNKTKKSDVPCHEGIEVANNNDSKADETTSDGFCVDCECEKVTVSKVISKELNPSAFNYSKQIHQASMMQTLLSKSQDLTDHPPKFSA